MRRTIRRWAIAPALVAIVLVAAACGDDGAAETAAGATGGDQGEAMDGEEAMGPFGTACSDVPSAGDGSFEGMMTQPVVAAASANPLLTSLAADVELAGLADTLNTAEAITVFAPSNAAFEAAGAADPEGMEMMMADPTGEFAELLAYHVVEGQLEPDQLAGEHSTLQGSTLTVEGGGPSFTVDGEAMVVCGAIHTDNATVYVIDQVLHP
jgi:uncharacterized surface protein with fasciclin (FAS1) repeats